MTTIGKAIESERKRRKLSQEKLATTVGLSSSTIRRLEDGDPRIERETLRRVADYLGLWIPDLDGGESATVIAMPATPRVDVMGLISVPLQLAAKIRGVADEMNESVDVVLSKGLELYLIQVKHLAASDHPHKASLKSQTATSSRKG